MGTAALHFVPAFSRIQREHRFIKFVPHSRMGIVRNDYTIHPPLRKASLFVREVGLFDQILARVWSKASTPEGIPNDVAGVGQEKKGWQISLETQLPSPLSGNDFGAVFELTKFPLLLAKSTKEPLVFQSQLRLTMGNLLLRRRSDRYDNGSIGKHHTRSQIPRRLAICRHWTGIYVGIALLYVDSWTTDNIRCYILGRDISG